MTRLNQTVLSPQNPPTEVVRPSRTVHNPQIHALRAIAVSMVLLYHLWPSRYSGGFIGVDVFLVISGFLITGQLLRQLDQGFSVLPKFWMRRLLRLAPAALTVVLASGLVSLAVLPPALWQRYAKEAIASIGIFENVALFNDSVDYLAAENSPTAFQHYWSLSLEEQFYVVWPLMLLLFSVLLCRRASPAVKRRRMLLFVLVVAICSFSFSLAVLSSSPSAAYFLMPWRVWEFAIGGVFAIVAAGGLFSKSFRGKGPILAASYGLLIVYGFLLDGTFEFPGWFALLAVAITSAIVFLSLFPGRSNWIAWAENNRVTVFLGDISYAAYLWHWPLIVLIPFALQRPLDLTSKLGILGVTLFLAWVTTRWVEKPFRHTNYERQHFKPKAKLSLLSIAALVTVALWGGMALSAGEAVNRQGVDLTKDCVGYLALKNLESCGGDIHGTGKVSIEALAAASADRPSPWKEDCVAQYTQAEDVYCEFKTQEGTAPALLLWGDSHAGAWAPAFEVAANELGYNLYVFTRDGCPPSQVSPVATVFRSIDQVEQQNCRDRNQQVLEFISDHPEIEGVYLASFSTNYSYDERHPFGDLDQIIGKLDAEGLNVAVVSDVPLTGPSPTERVNIPDCLQQNLDNLSLCDNPRELAQDSEAQQKYLQGKLGNILDVIPTAEYFCDPGTCYSVIGGVTVFFDASHLTDTYARSVGLAMVDQLKPLLAHSSPK